MKEKKDAVVLQGFFSSILSLFISLPSLFSDVTCIFPFFYKRGTQHNTTKRHRGMSTWLSS